MSKLELFSIGEQHDWDKYIDLEIGENYFEKVAKQIFNKEYDKVTHHIGLHKLLAYFGESDIAIRFDNCYAKVNLDNIFSSNILHVIERLALSGGNVLLYCPTEPYSKVDMRLCLKYIRTEARSKIHYANCNPKIFEFNDTGLQLHYIDYFSLWTSAGNKHFVSQVNFKKPQRDFLSLNLTIRPSKKFILDELKDKKLYHNGYISDDTQTIDALDVTEGRYNIRSMQGKYQKHPNFYNISPFTKAVYFELINEDVFGYVNDNQYLHNSEKTFRSIYNKMPFIIYGRQHQLKYLKGLGYKTYNALFDESYDDIKDDKERGKCIVNEIEKFCLLDRDKKEELVTGVKQIVDHNYNLINEPNNVGKIYHYPVNSN